jgi:hypothetical protein
VKTVKTEEGLAGRDIWQLALNNSKRTSGWAKNSSLSTSQSHNHYPVAALHHLIIPSHIHSPILINLQIALHCETKQKKLREKDT